MKNFKNIRNKQKGFTIIETLVALVVITLALAGFINLVVVGMRTFEASELRYTAAKIAQEGMELAINKRDNHILCIESGSCPISDWQDNLLEAGGAPGSWQVDSTELGRLLSNLRFSPFDPLKKIDIITNPPQDVGKYGYRGGVKTGSFIPGSFVREVKITKLSDSSILVQSIVTWTGRIISKQIVLEEILFGLP